jgi:hypothetical protein
MANFQKLQLSLILKVARQIWQILQISAIICRILQISPGSANSKPKFYSKKLAKVCSENILQSVPILWLPTPKPTKKLRLESLRGKGRLNSNGPMMFSVEKQASWPGSKVWSKPMQWGSSDALELASISIITQIQSGLESGTPVG